MSPLPPRKCNCKGQGYGFVCDLQNELHLNCHEENRFDLSAFSINSATEVTSIFSSTRARWWSIVRGLTSNCRPIFLLDVSAGFWTMNCAISFSLVVRVSNLAFSAFASSVSWLTIAARSNATFMASSRTFCLKGFSKKSIAPALIAWTDWLDWNGQLN